MYDVALRRIRIFTPWTLLRLSYLSSHGGHNSCHFIQVIT